MSERWREILQQLTSELERQTEKLQQLQTENEQLREGVSADTSPASPSTTLRKCLDAISESREQSDEAMNHVEAPEDSPRSPKDGHDLEGVHSAGSGSDTEEAPVSPWDSEGKAAKARQDKVSVLTFAGPHSEGAASPREGWSCNGDHAARTTDGLPKIINKTQADAMLQAQFDIVREKHGHVEVTYAKKAWFVVNPQRSNKFAAWQVLTILALGWVITIVPFQVGLMEPTWGTMLMLSTIVDVIFFIDVILQFITMYPRPTQSGVVWEQKVSKIAKHYVKTWFALDAITLIPFDIIDLVFSGNSVEVGDFKATKIFRTLRLLKLMRILKTSRWLHRVEITISLPYQQFALFRFLCILLLVCHWLACIWAMTLQLADENKPRWIDDIQEIDVAWNIKTVESPVRTYISSLYFCTYTMTSVGYGDIGPKNILERVACTLIVLTAGLCWAYVLGEVCAIVSDMNAETQHFRKKMTELNRMMKEQNLPYSLRCRMRSFFLQNRYQALYVTRQKLRECMSPQLQSEICTAVNAPWIQKVSFFNTFMSIVQESESNGEDVDAHRACIADVSQALECGAFAQGERFDNVQVLYIVSKGIVALNSRVGTNGAVWGEDFVLSDTELIRPIKGCALTYLEVLFLTRDVFMKVIERRKKTCPMLGQIVRKFCIKLAVRRAFVAEAQRRVGLSDAPKRQGAILVRKSMIAPPTQIPPAQDIRPRHTLPGSLNEEC